MIKNDKLGIPLNSILSIIGVGLVAFSGTLLETAMNVTFPILMKVFSVPIGSVQWITTGYLLVSSCVMMLSGIIQKNFDIKKVFIIGSVVFVISLFICYFAENFELLIIGRLISGIATGLIIPLLFLMIDIISPPKYLGFFMSLGTLITSLSPALGPTYGGVISNFLGWRNIFLITVPFVVLGIILVSNNIEDLLEIKKEKVNYLEFIIISIIFSCIQLLFNHIDVLIMTALVVGIFFYILIYKKSTTHIVDLCIFKSRGFFVGFSMFFLMQVVNVALGGFLFPNYMQEILHQNSFLTGILMLPGLMTRIMLLPLSGKIYDKVGEKVIIFGNYILLLSFILFLFFVHMRNTLSITVVYMVYNAGFSLSFSNMMTFDYQLVKQEYITETNSVLNTASQYSGGIGIALMSYILQFSPTLSDMAYFKCFVVLLICTCFVLVGCLILFNSLKSSK